MNREGGIPVSPNCQQRWTRSNFNNMGKQWHPLPNKDGRKKAFCRLGLLAHIHPLPCPFPVEKTGKDRNERRGDDRTEIERKIGEGGDWVWFGLQDGLEEKFIFILFFYYY